MKTQAWNNLRQLNSLQEQYGSAGGTMVMKRVNENIKKSSNFSQGCFVHFVLFSLEKQLIHFNNKADRALLP